MAQRLLLADDSITIQKVVELVLAEEGFDIKAAGDGEGALGMIGEFRPDIVLADIDMPKMNGYQLCERIKTNPETRSIPVILLAGAFEPLDEELAKNVGAEDYIVKPFESQELIGKINAVIASGEMSKGSGEEAEEVAEAVEAGEAEEDLWAMEELSAEPLAAESFAEETLLEEPVPEETFDLTEEAEEAKAVESPVAEEPSPPTVPARAADFAVPEIALPSKEEVAGMLRESIDGKVSSMLASLDMKNVILSSLGPPLKDSTEKVLWEVAPELVEKLLKEMLQGALASLTKEVEKVIWETVPELAESMISKEIERIKSEL